MNGLLHRAQILDCVVTAANFHAFTGLVVGLVGQDWLMYPFYPFDRLMYPLQNQHICRIILHSAVRMYTFYPSLTYHPPHKIRDNRGYFNPRRLVWMGDD